MRLDVLAILQELSFTEYEAKAYLALLEKAPLSGYAVSLNSGVPRSKIYEVLGGMVARGDVMISQEDTPLYLRWRRRSYLPSASSGRSEPSRRPGRRWSSTSAPLSSARGSGISPAARPS
jgi:hypothetical protein